MNDKLLVIILHFGSIEDTLECLNSLQQYIRSIGLDILVVNNGPDYAIETILKEAHPNVIYHYAGRDTGFAAGNNIGLRIGVDRGYEYALLLNNDTVAEQDFIRPLLDAMRADAKIAMAGPAMFYYSDKDKLWSLGGKIKWWNGGVGGETDSGKLSLGRQDTAYLPGACILVRMRSLLKIGLMNEAYFLGVEEADWAIEARRAGFRVVACPQSVLLHKVGMSSQRSPELIYNAVRNRFVFLRCQIPRPIRWLLAPVVLLSELRRDFEHRRLCWRAFRDHLKFDRIERRHLDAIREAACAAH